jgi:hypothetical protein
MRCVLPAAPIIPEQGEGECRVLGKGHSTDALAEIQWYGLLSGK